MIVNFQSNSLFCALHSQLHIAGTNPRVHGFEYLLYIVGILRHTYLVASCPIPAVLQRSNRILPPPPWCKNSEDMAPVWGNRWPSSSDELGEDGRLRGQPAKETQKSKTAMNQGSCAVCFGGSSFEAQSRQLLACYPTAGAPARKLASEEQACTIWHRQWLLPLPLPGVHDQGSELPGEGFLGAKAPLLLPNL